MKCSKPQMRPGLTGKVIFIWQAANFIAITEGISRWRQFCDIFLLLFLRRLGPKLYYEASLWRPHWTLSDKLGFMNQQNYKKRVAQLNPKPYQKLSQHKLAEKALFQLLAIPTPTYVGFFHPTKGVCLRGDNLSSSKQLARLLQSHQDCILCFKPTEGYGGTGFVAAQVQFDNGEYKLKRLNAIATETVPEFVHRYLNHADGYLIEQYLTQHPLMAEMNPTSVNTLRIWVKQQDSEVNILGAMLRIGRAGSLVDNSGQGGIIAYIDLAKGVLGQGRTTEIFPSFFDQHPDNQAQITGRPLPHWQACLELAQRTLRSFPQAHFTGLDLAIGVDGPVIIEMNLEPDKISARIFDKSHKQLLG